MLAVVKTVRDVGSEKAMCLLVREIEGSVVGARGATRSRKGRTEIVIPLSVTG
jgi:hypothetical protein